MTVETFADQLLAAPMINSTGETMSTKPGVTARPYLDTEAPTSEEASTLVQQLMGAGVVARLDLVHDALRAAFRRGQAAERAESNRLAMEAAERFAAAAQELAAQHAEQFSVGHLQRAQEQADQDARPWFMQ